MHVTEDILFGNTRFFPATCMHSFMCMCMCMRTCMCLFACMCMHSLYAHRICAPAAASNHDPMKMVCTNPAV